MLFPEVTRISAHIHPSAVIDPSARLAPDVEIGPFAVIGRESQIGAGSRIAAHAVIGDYTILGEDCRVSAYAVVGSPSQDLKHRESDISWLKIGRGNRIREFVTINRATAAGSFTQIGDENLFMAYAHVAHDCQLGNRIVLANGATLGGHVEIADDVVIGAMSGIHQFVRIGRLSMVGAMSRVCQDVPPFLMAVGSPPRVYGLNSVGLRRQNFSTQSRQQLKQAFQLIYRKNLAVAHALEQLDEIDRLPELNEFLDFIRHSQRGLVGLTQPDYRTSF
ncbi:acyl-[acyl-carrier-protein]--UDP-N-acetylglucosamine O-acyltransferase [bacterium (Candidatus Blackallbacteria) CG17_big_fil_post_rev_8_21_14_2_50_48_46]|uniref:Acyl-[acyl-carrier-protein]--UDP-N-acetylglucosamine O-acyltransferase n=1 Tax=bacterium (Candidatus Blackallbacteria) CG17_big_fil_post_rev_8_21_14_2_50_48_46 TaxID=2014261 RepID=A0A2M7G392_9BACT|nr:MAG: acyl-[acyl-carrier-protein]--UDP-N-acetylglucosamine O-acyltransferase [bacterium (Candidatus Blackallbacteria) CG18_big_fil_WC_8_21_14_2_50_49_26]PIW16302.1 MAG: acyl-[acyl-carrier-protein]--UDP-N-acetylglucosamine O-acyltransferase [bacterium (Candidatus Blackallbacteria) CG17_big_fil_post_rev_8_21_14_2_50_48_46]PIW45316.1 MAG: acyl-[acyl-carrier-protein]--UDP-N-acetylglucosamine O-acyltransferase [bacterium (Candidatus Blackallbacteria) CG13_big_fil_rev_8_21_14_2_50_49_14]